MKSARSSRIFSWCLLSCCVLLLGLGHSEVGGLDFIDQVHPPSLKGYCFVLVVTNFLINLSGLKLFLWRIWLTKKHGAITIIPFWLIHGQEAVVPVEMNLAIFRLVERNELSAELSWLNDGITSIKSPTCVLRVLREIDKDRLRVAAVYNIKVKPKSFQVGELMWKDILPIGAKSGKFGK